MQILDSAICSFESGRKKFVKEKCQIINLVFFSFFLISTFLNVEGEIRKTQKGKYEHVNFAFRNIQSKKRKLARKKLKSGIRIGERQKMGIYFPNKLKKIDFDVLHCKKWNGKRYANSICINTFCYTFIFKMFFQLNELHFL